MNVGRSQHYQLLLDSFSVQFNNEEFADCILIAEGKSVKVHRAILCSNSSFLQKIVADHKDVDVTLIIEGIRFDDLYLVTQFLYRGNVAISGDRVRSVLLVAELLGMKWISDVCVLCNGDAAESNSANAGNGNLATATPAAATVSSKALLPALKNITNTLSTKAPKRRRYERTRKSPKTMKIGRRHSYKAGSCRAVGRDESPHDAENRLETDLAQMDENTFCTALGLKKNVEVRDLINVELTNSSSFCSRAVPPLLEVLSSDAKSKRSGVDRVSESTNTLCESSPVYIEAKNLSFLNIDTNELYIRENNIEIECDVLDVASHNLLFDKGNDDAVAGNILQLGEGNSVRVVDNPEDRRRSVSRTKSDRTVNGAVHKHSSRDTTTSNNSTSTFTAKVARGASRDNVSALSTCGESTIFWCDVCQRTYHTKTGLNQHKRYECCKDPAFACPRCEKRFKRKSSLVRHAITLHNEAVYPTRTKLLSKLTSPRTIAGKR